MKWYESTVYLQFSARSLQFKVSTSLPWFFRKTCSRHPGQVRESLFTAKCPFWKTFRRTLRWKTTNWRMHGLGRISLHTSIVSAHHSAMALRNLFQALQLCRLPRIRCLGCATWIGTSQMSCCWHDVHFGIQQPTVSIFASVFLHLGIDQFHIQLYSFTMFYRFCDSFHTWAKWVGKQICP